MRKNMGTFDKGIRLFAAVVLVALYFAEILTGMLGAVGLVLAAVFTLTSMISFCPLYTILGVKTNKTVG